MSEPSPFTEAQPKAAHRMLPQAPDAEQSLLACFLLAPREIGALCMEKGITTGHFHIPGHSHIYRVLMDMWDRGEPIDFILLTAKLRDLGLLDSCGGPGFITQLFTLLPTACNAEYYREICEEKYILREIIKIGTTFAAKAYDDQDEVHQLRDSFEARVMAMARLNNRKPPSLRQDVIEVIDAISRACESKGEPLGLRTGFAKLDEYTDGLHAGEMFVIAARPSHGKTALAMNIAEYVALELGKPVGIFSLEMSRQQLVHRLLCGRAKVNYHRIRHTTLFHDDAARLSRAADEISKSKIFIDDESGMSIQRIRAKARRMKSEHDVCLVITDYLQLANSERKRSSGSRVEELTEISQGCKLLARELGIPHLVLAQVNREVAKEKRRPRLPDLAGCGAIECDADTVAFLVNEEVQAENDEEKEECRGKAYLAIAKQRHGPCSDVPLTFLAEYTRFVTRAQPGQQPEDPQLPL